VLNLLFRPIVLIASSHLLAQLEKDEQPHGTTVNQGIPSLPE
jgi:hypothetical protein